ncbi:phospholipase D-like domain-containing protein [Romboutsia lituseburensis]|uniref:phospholipase D-like domain-containing protein n=1 Tax=Romboutsia lituseburensis TaxID=1537 RepID=UPI00215A4D9E|nr:phospholipase D-like domain-containing protein [Romboutsia lituseburensis]MCR8743901.1 phospholipase D-like domain-containing protein [Romboutsia lituseburensis]
MENKVYNIDTNKRRINFVIREIIRNKYKNVQVYAPLYMELEIVSSIKQFFKIIELKPISNYIEIKIGKIDKDLINFYITNGLDIVGKVYSEENTKENIVVLDSYKNTKIKIDKLSHDELDVIKYCYSENSTKNHQEIENIRVTHIDHFKLRNTFLNIIKNTKQRLDIMSPWINDIACDYDVLELIKSALEKGVDINIVYGIGNGDDKRNKKSDEVANQMQHKLKSKNYKGNLSITKKDSHYKAILCDDDISMCGSLNYLSCNPENTNSIEGADLIISSEIVNIKRKLYFDAGDKNE